MTEGLFDHNAAPGLRIRWLGQATFVQMRQHRGEDRRRYGQVERVVATGAALCVEGLDLAAKSAVGLGVGGITGHEADALGEPFPGRLIEPGARMLLDCLTHGLGEVLVFPITARESNECEAGR